MPSLRGSSGFNAVIIERRYELRAPELGESENDLIWCIGLLHQTSGLSEIRCHDHDMDCRV
jgi:hypothetical protein